MARIITRADVSAFFDRSFGIETRDQYQAFGEMLVAWATEPEQYALSDEVDAVELLIHAADFFEDAGDRDRAFATATRARGLIGPSDYRTHATFVGLHLAAGDVEAAKAAADEARQSAASDALLAEQLGEMFELAEQFALAQRWYTIGVRAVERQGLRSSDFYQRLLEDRYRVRRDAGLGIDVIDVQTEELRRLAPDR